MNYLQTRRDLVNYLFTFKGKEREFNLENFFYQQSRKEDGTICFSRKGYLYEGLVDTYIKLKFPSYKHYEGNPDSGRPKEIDNLIRGWLDGNLNQSSKGGSSDVTFKDGPTWYLSSVKSSPNVDQNSSGLGNLVALEQADWLFPNETVKFYMFCSQVEKVSSWYSNNQKVRSKITFIGFKELELEIRSLIQTIRDPFELLERRVKPLPQIQFRDHQLMTIQQLRSRREKVGFKTISLIGHKPRSGKTYIFAKDILTLNQNKDVNVKQKIAFISGIPNTSFEQTKKLLNRYDEFNGKYQIYSSSEEKDFRQQLMKDEGKNIYLISIQWLSNDGDRNFEEMRNYLVFDLIYVDEAHHVSSSPNSRSIINQIYQDSRGPMVLMTATYSSVIEKWFNFGKEDIFTWSLEDEKLAAQGRANDLIHKHGLQESFRGEIDLFTSEESKSYYRGLPTLTYLSTFHTAVFRDELDQNPFYRGTGFDMDEIFRLDQGRGRFVHYDRVLEILDYLLGRRLGETNSKTIPDRIKDIDSSFEPRAQLWFLPTVSNQGKGYLNQLSNLLKELIESFKGSQNHRSWGSKYRILIVNSEINESDHQIGSRVETEYEIAKKENKKLIIFAGLQLSMGISLPFVDVVVLLNNLKSSEKIIQMTYRALTEDFASRKTRGYVVDLNQKRILDLIIEIFKQGDLKGLSLSNPSSAKPFFLVSLDPDNLTEAQSQDLLLRRWSESLIAEHHHSFNSQPTDIFLHWLKYFKSQHEYFFLDEKERGDKNYLVPEEDQIRDPEKNEENEDEFSEGNTREQSGTKMEPGERNLLKNFRNFINRILNLFSLLSYGQTKQGYLGWNSFDNLSESQNFNLCYIFCDQLNRWYGTSFDSVEKASRLFF